jgi:hypothetical protein
MSFRLPSDKLGICVSTLCGIHCLALPVLLLVGAETWIQFVYHESVEKLLLSSALVIALIAFIPGYLSHRRHYIMVLFISGFLLLASGEAYEDVYARVAISAFGAAVVVYAHFLNYTLRMKKRTL